MITNAIERMEEVAGLMKAFGVSAALPRLERHIDDLKAEQFPRRSDPDVPESMTVTVYLSDGQRTKGWYDYADQIWYVLDQATNQEVVADSVDFWSY